MSSQRQGDERAAEGCETADEPATEIATARVILGSACSIAIATTRGSTRGSTRGPARGSVRSINGLPNALAKGTPIERETGGAEYSFQEALLEIA